jgi:hypothetical protein
MMRVTTQFEHGSISEAAAPVGEPVSHSQVLLSLIVSLVVSFLG